MFNLGFGFKYQYLLSALVYTLITKDINFRKSKKFIDKKINQFNINANSNTFFTQLEELFNDFSSLKYKTNALLLLEGEYSCFEDINLFTSKNGKSLISYYQVKGSISTSRSSLNQAVLDTILNMFNNQNGDIPFKLFILINQDVTNYLFAKTNGDIKKIILMIIKKMSFFKNFEKKHKNHKQYTVFLQALSEYLDNSFKLPSGESLNIYYHFYQFNKTHYQSLKIFIKSNELFKAIERLKYILNNTKVITKLDYRLVYLFLKYQYGNDALNKLVWNIEVKAMDGTHIKKQELQNRLKMIKFNNNYIRKIKFSKSNNKIRVGKIL